MQAVPEFASSIDLEVANTVEPTHSVERVLPVRSRKLRKGPPDIEREWSLPNVDDADQ